MTTAVIFNELPATFPENDKYKAPAAAGSLVLHIVLVTGLILFPLLMPEQIPSSKLVALITLTPPPPPPPPAPAPALAVPSRPAVMIQPVAKVSANALLMPIAIPKEIARVIDEPVGAEFGGVPGGVPGGVSGGVVGGILHGILAANSKLPDIAPPPPPPPVVAVAPRAPEPIAPATPVRVGGSVQEPKPMRVVAPIYPKLALKARVHGSVILEATLTEDGTVEEIRVVSGHPLLLEAAIDAVKQWRYEPTYLNGKPVAVIFNARVNFELAQTATF